MNKILTLCLGLGVLMSCNKFQKGFEEQSRKSKDSIEKKYQEVEISNGLVKAGLRLPDPEKGYYRGVRFDWSGDMPYLEYDGHSYFGEWSDKEYYPTRNDAIMGPVEVFNPIGYGEADVGEDFLKIGIGMVTRPDTLAFHYNKEYLISDHGKWSTKIMENAVTFKHELNSNGYGYQYVKVVELPENKPELILRHSLKNIGAKTIKTSVFNHNFFVIDNQRTGPDFSIALGFEPTNTIKKFDSLMRFNRNELEFKKVFDDDESVFIQFLQGFTDEVSDYDIKIENRKTGAGVRITSNHPIEYRFLFWISYKTINPEPYIVMEIQPGETYEWTTRYEFYTVETF